VGSEERPLTTCPFLTWSEQDQKVTQAEKKRNSSKTNHHPKSMFLFSGGKFRFLSSYSRMSFSVLHREGKCPRSLFLGYHTRD